MSTVQFVVPPSWGSLTELSQRSCTGSTVGEALSWFAEQYPMLRERFLTDDGAIAPWALVCLNHIDVRTLAGLETPLRAEGAEIQIIPALMGG